MKKRLISLLLAVVMVFGMFALTACNQAPAEDMFQLPWFNI